MGSLSSFSPSPSPFRPGKGERERIMPLDLRVLARFEVRVVALNDEMGRDDGGGKTGPRPRLSFRVGVPAPCISAYDECGRWLSLLSSGLTRV
jgi:hypothetical protein